MKESYNEGEKPGLKLNIQNLRWWHPVLSLHGKNGENVETVSDFIFLVSKINTDGDWSLKIKRHLLLGRIAMKNLDRVLKIRDITLLSNVRIVKAMVWPVVTYGCENWTIKKTEYQRIDAFGLWYWRRLLRDPWTARRWNQSILKEINPEYWLEGWMLKLKLWYFGHLMWRAKSLEKTLILGKTECKRRGWQRMRCWMASLTQWTLVCANLGNNEVQGSLVCCNSWSCRVRHSLVTKQVWSVASWLF